MAKPTQRESRDYAIARLTDGAPSALILDELISEQKLSETTAIAALSEAKGMIARNFDEPDYQLIRACAFAGDSYRQLLYRQRIESLLEAQELIKDDPSLDTEVRMRLILACDRSMQGWATASLRGRRDLPVAFAPKAVLQNQEPPSDEEIDDAISGAL
jgi:hypothetical protein